VQVLRAIGGVFVSIGRGFYRFMEILDIVGALGALVVFAVLLARGRMPNNLELLVYAGAGGILVLGVAIGLSRRRAGRNRNAPVRIKRTRGELLKLWWNGGSRSSRFLLIGLLATTIGAVLFAPWPSAIWQAAFLFAGIGVYYLVNRATTKPPNP
jgi:hypothetical protein